MGELNFFSSFYFSIYILKKTAYNVNAAPFIILQQQIGWNNLFLFCPECGA